MALQQPVAMQPASGDSALLNTAIQFRNFTTTLVAVANTFTGSEGIPSIGVPASGAATGEFAVTQRGAGANGSVDVSAGHALVNGDDVTGQGCYQCWNDGVVNVAVPLSPPAQRNHRLVLQVQDKLSNGSWSGYQAQLTLLQDTGGGTPALPNSALTLAIITVNPSDVSVQNAAIADYRRACGPVSAFTASNENRGNTTLADSASLQLWGLRSSASYGLLGFLNYDGNDMANPGDAGGILITFRTPGPSNVKVTFTAPRLDSLNTVNVGAVNIQTDSWRGWTDGTSANHGIIIAGSIQTTSTTPNNFAALQFAQNVSSGQNTRILVGSMLYAWPIT